MYVGGRFDRIGGQDRANIGAIDSTTGRATNWHPTLSSEGSGWVNAISIRDSTVYIAGDFNAIGAASRSNAGAIDANTGLATPWNPDTATVLTIAIAGSSVYLGGKFDSVGRASRRDLGAVDAKSGEATRWNPRPITRFEASHSGELLNDDVEAVVVSGSTVYVGGFLDSSGALGFAAYPR